MPYKMTLFRFPLLIFPFCIAALVQSQSLANQVPSPATSERETALALEQQGNASAAESAWRTVLQHSPRDAEAHAHLGVLEARRESYEDAIEEYREALAVAPAMPGLRLNLGLALFKSGDLKSAVQAFTPLLKTEPLTSPDRLRVVTLIGLAHYGLGDYAAAVPFLKKATASDPQNLPFRLALAHSCLSSKQYSCVMDVYHEILTLNAESAEADMLAGEALDEMRDHGGAIQQFRSAIKADPKFPDAHFGLGYLLWTQNQFEEASKEFKAELENVPDHAQALAYLGDCEIQLDKAEDALPSIEKALKLSPGLARAHLDRGILYANQGSHQDALKEFKIAATLTPDDPNVHWRMARLYQAMGKRDEAKAEFDKTNSLHKAENATLLSKMRAAHDRASNERQTQPAQDAPK